MVNKATLFFQILHSQYLVSPLALSAPHPPYSEMASTLGCVLETSCRTDTPNSPDGPASDPPSHHQASRAFAMVVHGPHNSARDLRTHSCWDIMVRCRELDHCIRPLRHLQL